MAKIPVILEAGRADGKLATSSTIFDENKGMFQSEINDIQDTLNSDNSNKPLSAKQGKVLKELLDNKVIEAGAVPIDSEPTEGNITHVVNSDSLAKEFNKCNTAIINTNRIKDGAVTTNKLEHSIQSLITNISKTATFAGIATPTTNPGTPDGPVFYIANGKGAYTNFGGIDVTEDEVVILYYDTSWHKNTTGMVSNDKLTELENEVGVKKFSNTVTTTTTVTILDSSDVKVGDVIYYKYTIDNGRLYVENSDGTSYMLHEASSGEFEGSFVISSVFSKLFYTAYNGSVRGTLVFDKNNEVLKDNLHSVIANCGVTATLDVLTNNVYSPISMYIRESEIFYVRVSGNFKFGRVLIGYNGAVTPDKRLKDYVEKDKIYKFTAPADIDKITVGLYDTGDSGKLSVTVIKDSVIANALNDIELLKNDKDDIEELSNKVDIYHGKNWYSNPKIFEGSFLKSNGDLSTHASRSYTDFIRIEGGKNYHISRIGDIALDDNVQVCHCFYNKDKNLVGYMLAKELNVSVPANAYYVRLSGYTEVFNQIQIELGSERTAYEPYSPIDGYLGDKLNGKLDIKSGKNKYSNPNVTDGAYLTNNGNLSAHSARSYTDYIQITPNTNYHVSMAGDGNFDDNANVCHCFYDADKNFIGYSLAKDKNLTSPNNARYIRLSGYTYKFANNPQIEEGNERTTYEPYSPIAGYTIPSSGGSGDNPLKGKKVICFGDSITEFVDADEKGYCEYLAELSSATVIRAGVGGMWLTSRKAPTSTPASVNDARAAFDVCNLIDAWIDNDYTKVEPSNQYLIENDRDDNTRQINALKNNPIGSVDVITIFASTNDFGNGVQIGTNTSTEVNSICGAYRHIIERICTANKKVRVFIFTPIIRYFGNVREDIYFSDYRKNQNDVTLRDYANAIMSVAANEHIASCNLYDTLGWNKYNFSNYFYDNDNVHPYKGMSYIAQRMFSFICSSY